MGTSAAVTFLPANRPGDDVWRLHSVGPVPPVPDEGSSGSGGGNNVVGPRQD